jgi:tetratricopeptide (TPR) repeat protein
VELDVNSVELHASLGIALSRTHRARAAVTHLEAALRRKPDLAVAQAELAWLLATSDDPSVFDAAKALRLARSLTTLEPTEFDRVRSLDILAAALAALGRYDDAVTAAERAAQLARDRNNHALARRIDDRLDLYESALPYVLPGPAE